MKYLGSKKKYAKYILPIILKDRGIGQTYVEPFVGGANTFMLVNNPRAGGELNKYQYVLLKALQDGWLPDLVDEETYDRIHAYYDPKWAASRWHKGKTTWRKKPYKLRADEHYTDELIGFAGIVLSFKGKWWGGYSRDNTGLRNYSREALNNVKKLAPQLRGAKLYNLSYDDLPIPPNSLIYCDPPYVDTTEYSIRETGTFDTALFWTWCRDKINEGHTVFVSEYTAPDDFQAVWEKQLSGTGVAKGKASTEKLFIHKSQMLTENHILKWNYFKL